MPASEIASDMEADDHRKENDHEQNRKYANHHWDRQLGWQRVGFLLGAREPLVPHIVAVNAHRISDARAQVNRLVDQCRESAGFFQGKTIGGMLERILQRPPRADFKIGQMDIGAE